MPVIMAIVEALKQSGMDSKFAAIVSLSLGILFGLLFIEMGGSGLVQGILAGLSASGLYSGAKKVVE